MLVEFGGDSQAGQPTTRSPQILSFALLQADKDPPVGQRGFFATIGEQGDPSCGEARIPASAPPPSVPTGKDYWPGWEDKAPWRPANVAPYLHDLRSVVFQVRLSRSHLRPPRRRLHPLPHLVRASHPQMELAPHPQPFLRGSRRPRGPRTAARCPASTATASNAPGARFPKCTARNSFQALPPVQADLGSGLER